MPKILPTDDLTVKLHTASDGHVWILDGDGSPENSGLSVSKFVRSSRAGRDCKARIVGLKSNVHLLLEFYAGKLDGWVRSLEVCSPLAGESCGRRGNPGDLLFDMRNWNARPSCGGWHEFVYCDYLTYNLVLPTSLQPNRNLALSCLMDHPLWSRFSMFQHVDPFAFAIVLAEMLDPRFFVDRLNPDRQSKLEAYLGLDPVSIQRGGEKRRRFEALVACWKNRDPGHNRALRDPQWFIWKAWYKAVTKNPLTADLRACQFFLSFLRQAWLDVLYADNPWKESLFVPDHFLEPAEAEWYTGKLKRNKK